MRPAAPVINRAPDDGIVTRLADRGHGMASHYPLQDRFPRRTLAMVTFAVVGLGIVSGAVASLLGF
jgi:hypothetical protein